MYLLTYLEFKLYINEYSIVAMVIKGCLVFKIIFFVRRICVHDVMRALRRLRKNPFYRLKNVIINQNWKQVFGQNKDAYACEIGVDTKISDDNNYYDQEVVTKMQLHGFSDSYSIYDLRNNQMNIALGEGYKPLGTFRDNYSEEMSFPTLFYRKK